MFIPMWEARDASFEVAVVGGGAAGFAAALTAAIGGFRTVIFAPPAEFPPGRTAALLEGSVRLLSELDVWPALAQHVAPLRAIRLVDATRRLIRAAEVTFHASEVGLPAFGYNVPNARLLEGLRRHAESFDLISVRGEPVDRIEIDGDRVRLLAGGFTFTARLLVAADGAHSLARAAAGIRVRRWTYPQAALVGTFTITHQHQGVSTEFHTEKGPFTLVPLPGQRVSLVWMDDPQALRGAMELPAERLSRLVEERARSIHGAMHADSKPALFPLGAALADRFAAKRTILVGEAAHLFPPIGAQGLNLGLRDVASLRQALHRHRRDPGAPSAIAGYHEARSADVRLRTLAVDLMNRSLLTDFLPVQLLRSAGLGLAAGIPALRKTLMYQGLGTVPRR